ncbi:MAG: hypothetical protein RBT63_07120 [Bdellovibrionales bacterium]|jgi:hypothetical protein|nr:hypothetical protein [Bdellovibrionales bacterium]
MKRLGKIRGLFFHAICIALFSLSLMGCSKFGIGGEFSGGSIGDGSSNDNTPPPPVVPPPVGPPVVAVKTDEIFKTEQAFAALKSDGSVVTWGGLVSGGDSSGIVFKTP